jgi:aminoglycoside phosphotransferase (APT) family kinase protein
MTIWDELALWAADVVGESSVTLTKRSGGGSHQALDVVGASGRRWFLKADAAPADDDAYYTLRREAVIYRAVKAAGLPAPHVIGVHPTHEAVVLERVDGDAGFAKLSPDSQQSIVDDFVPWLSKLHAADPSTLGLEALGPIGTIDSHVRDEIDVWEARLDASGAQDAVLKACFVWLRANQPDTGDARPSLIQGDTGPGNFLHDGSKVTAFLDFELGHLGDPMTDLAWVGTRNAQEPVPDFAAFLTSYAAASGRAVDPERFRYHALLAELRIAVLGAVRVSGQADLEAEHGNQLIYGTLHRRLTVEALATAMGVDLPTVELPDLADTPDTRYFDAALHQMRTIVGPNIGEPYAARRHRSMARVVKYLRELDRSGDTHTTAELADLTAVLGQAPASLAAGRADLFQRVISGQITAIDVLPYAYAQVMRRQQLVGPAMGILATRHLPVI